jgi:hypothetical protein
MKKKLRKEKNESKVIKKNFRDKQTFGPASKVRHLTIEEYLKNGGNTSIINGLKNER